MKSSRVCACLSVALVACGFAACQSQEQVVQYKPFFAGLPGAEGDKNAVKPKAEHASALSSPNPAAGDKLSDEPLDPAAAANDPLVIENVDGSKTLIIRSIRHVMTHIERRLDEGDEGAKLLLDQVIADAAKKQFADEGKTPEQIIDYLREHQRDLAVLFSRLPFAEHTPGVFLDKQGRNRFVLKLPPLAQKGSNFTELWVQMEGGTWKFLWAK